MIWNNEINTPASYTDSNSESNMVRLIEDPDIKKSIKFDEISVIDNGIANATGDQLSTAGTVYPMIRINDVILLRDLIKEMVISTNSFLPTISLSFVATTVYFTNKNMPKDGDLVSTFFKSTSNELTYLRNDFVITSCTVMPKGSGGSFHVQLSGKLFVPKMISRNNTKGIIGTSKEAIKEIAKDCNLGFSFNDYEDTDDFQNWICCNNTYENFVNTITAHTWKNGTSFYKSWIDLYYDLCFVNVNKFLSTVENPENEIDITFNSSTLATGDLFNNTTGGDTSKLMVKFFSNLGKFSGTPFYISKWEPINNSFSISSRVGYTSKSYTFRHNQSLYNKDSKECFEEKDNIPGYDKNKTDSYIILRGRSKYEKGKNPEYEQERVNYNFVDTYINKNWTGFEYVLGSDTNKTDKTNNEWEGNVHPNYNRALHHNDININELNKLYIEITCDGVCLQVMKGERIPVLLTNNAIEALTGAPANRGSEPEVINKFYSGYYIIDSISYIYKSGNKVSNFSTKMILKRREWPAPEEIAASK